MADGRAQRVKHRLGRSIYLVQLGDRAVYVKHQRCDSLIQGLANLVRGSSARREWNLAVRAFDCGVPTARPLAWGEHFRHGWVRDSYFVTEAIEDAQPLDRLVMDRVERLPPARRLALRRLMVQRLARFVAGVHQSGLQHHDFHAGNMLVVADEIEEPDRPAIYLVDLAGARFSGPLDWAASRASLIVLHAEWFDRLTVAERWRFLRTYLESRPALRCPPRDRLFDELDRGARAHSRRIDRGRDRRTLRTNRDFLAIRRPGQRLHAVHGFPESVTSELLQKPDAVLLRGLGQPVKISHTTWMVCVDLPLGDRSIRVGFKRFRSRNGWKSFCDRFRRSRAARNWYRGHALLARRIATARPLIMCDGRRSRSGWFPPRESYVAVEWIEGAENLHLWAWRLAERSSAERLALASRCAAALGQLVGRMHARCVSHRDLKGSNLLVAVAGREVRTWLIDMDGVRIHRHLPARRRVGDLARLATSVEAHPWVSRTVRYLFLRAYAKQFPRGTIEERSLWRAVARRAGRRIARKKREQKPLL
ncbi:MAG: hypothetical protein JW888_02695 [Pirellulales bacterium]|nr:hypothetical protein [Pirellulales bacterium]